MSIFRGHAAQPRHNLVLILLFFWLVTPATCFAQAAVVELDHAVSMALDHSLELASLRAEAEAVRAASSQAGALPDPTLSLNAMNMPTDTFNLS